MGLLDIFSGSAGRNAAIWGATNTQGGAQQQRDYINRGTDLSLSALGGGYDSSLAALQGGNDWARADLQNATMGSNTALAHGLSGGLTALGQNAPSYRYLYEQGDQLLGNAGAQADAFYHPLVGGAEAGFSAYGDAAGVNGAQGQARARQNFQTGPGYNFARDEALQAATRGANAAGMTASGNTMDALSRLGNNLANQEWGSYVSRLSPYLNLAPQIAGQRSGIATNTAAQRAGVGQRYGENLGQSNQAIANLYGGFGRDTANLSSGYGTTLASLSSGLGSNRSALATGLGSNRSALYGNQATNLSNITGAETGSLTGLGTSGMMAGQQGNANLWNAGMQVANLGADLFGRMKNPFS